MIYWDARMHELLIYWHLTDGRRCWCCLTSRARPSALTWRGWRSSLSRRTRPAAPPARTGSRRSTPITPATRAAAVAVAAPPSYSRCSESAQPISAFMSTYVHVLKGRARDFFVGFSWMDTFTNTWILWLLYTIIYHGASWVQPSEKWRISFFQYFSCLW